MIYVPSKKNQKCAKMKTHVKFENISDSYVKFDPEIEQNDEKILRVTQDEVCAPPK